MCRKIGQIDSISLFVGLNPIFPVCFPGIDRSTSPSQSNNRGCYKRFYGRNISNGIVYFFQLVFNFFRTDSFMGKNTTYVFCFPPHLFNHIGDVVVSKKTQLLIAGFFFPCNQFFYQSFHDRTVIIADGYVYPDTIPDFIYLFDEYIPNDFIYIVILS